MLLPISLTRKTCKLQTLISSRYGNVDIDYYSHALRIKYDLSRNNVFPKTRTRSYIYIGDSHDHIKSPY